MKLKKLFGSKKNSTAPKQVQVGKYSLIANADHSIEAHLTHHKYYSRNLARIAQYLQSKYPTYNIIDVGANIGDTAALLRSGGVNQTIYAIEGEPEFIQMLQKNLQQFKDVFVYETFLGETDHIIDSGTELHGGTARLNQTGGKQIKIQKLDNLVKTDNLQNIKLFKIDTDGFDFKILRGSLDVIKEQKPVIFFEYDAVFLAEQGEHGTDMFNILRGLNYNTALFYDNFGKLLLSLTIDNIQLITQLFNYMQKKEGAFPYYDVCVFHSDDDALANEIITKETAFFKN